MDEITVTSKREYDTFNDSQKISRGVKYAHRIILRRLKKLEKNDGNDTSKEGIENLTKLTSALGYSAQVHGGLSKTVEHEKRITDIEKAIKIRDLMKMPEWGK